MFVNANYGKIALMQEERCYQLMSFDNNCTFENFWLVQACPRFTLLSIVFHKLAMFPSFMQLEKNRRSILEREVFWLPRFCLPRPHRSGWFQGKLCDSSLAPAMKNEGKMIMTAYSPPLNMSIPPLRWPWISGGCPILYSVSYHNPKIPTNNLIFGLSYITILWFLRTIWFLRCLLLHPYWLLPTVWFF